jgi:hypothetical protein
MRVAVLGFWAVVVGHWWWWADGHVIGLPAEAAATLGGV